MNHELEEILEAYNAAKQAGAMDEKHLLTLFELRLAGVLQRHPHLSRKALEGAVHCAYERWLNAQKKPTSLPPKA